MGIINSYFRGSNDIGKAQRLVLGREFCVHVSPVTEVFGTMLILLPLNISCHGFYPVAFGGTCANLGAS